MAGGGRALARSRWRAARRRVRRRHREADAGGGGARRAGRRGRAGPRMLAVLHDSGSRAWRARPRRSRSATGWRTRSWPAPASTGSSSSSRCRRFTACCGRADASGSAGTTATTGTRRSPAWARRSTRRRSRTPGPRWRSRDWPAELTATGLFRDVEQALFEHVHELPREALRDHLMSYSGVAALPEDERRRVLSQVAALLDSDESVSGEGRSGCRSSSPRTARRGRDPCPTGHGFPSNRLLLGDPGSQQLSRGTRLPWPTSEQVTDCYKVRGEPAAFRWP